MSEYPFNLKDALRPVWLRRRLLCVLAVLGLIVGVTYGVIFRAPQSAVALVLLPPSNVTSAGVPTRDIATEIAIATSAPVLSAAGRAVTPHLSFAAMKQQLVVTARSQNILQIEANAATGRDAERLANAAARQFVQFVTTTSHQSTSSVVRDLQKQSAALTEQLQQLQGQINTVSVRLAVESVSSPGGQTDTSLLGSLNAAQEQVSLELDNINNEIVSGQLSSAAQTTSGTEILQQATSFEQESLGSIAITGFVGLLAGAIAGVIIAALRERRDRRLFTRDDISSAIGLPVLGSVGAERRISRDQWLALFTDYEPGPVDVWNMRRILDDVRSAEPGGVAQLRVLSFVGDDAAAAVGPQLALFANSVGVTTGLTMAADESLEALRAVSATHAFPNRLDSSGSLFAPDPPHTTTAAPAVDLVLRTVVVDAAKPSIEGRDGRSVLAVSAGFASADALARLALAAADSGHRLDGVIIVNPYQGDTTTGLPTVALNGSATAANGSHGKTMAGAWVGTAPWKTSISGARIVGASGDDPPDERVGSFVSLRAIRSAAGQHRKAVVIVAVAGLVMGLSLHTVVPRKYAAEANLFLTEPSTSDPAQAMANDVSLLQTRAVAIRAMEILHLRDITPNTFLKSYQGVAVSNIIMSIAYSAHSPRGAVTGADAVAHAFLQVRARQLTLQTKVVVADLRQQVNTLGQQITLLGQNINILSGSSSSSGADELAGMVNQRGDDSNQVTQLEGQIEQQNQNVVAVTGGSEILDPAAAIVVSAKKVVLMDGLSGLVGGLGAVLAILVITTLLSDRLRSRSQLAEVLGAPVEASVGRVLGRGRVLGWGPPRTRRLRKQLDRPTDGMRIVERHLRGRLFDNGDTSLVVLSIAGVEVAALAVAGVAASVASEGRRVVMVDLAVGRPLARLVGNGDEPLVGRPVTVRGSTVELVVGDEPPDGAVMVGGGAIVVVLATLDPAVGAGYLARLAQRCVAIVDIRRAKDHVVRANREMLGSAGVTLLGAVAIDADPHDTSIGGSMNAAPHTHARHDLLGAAP